MKPSRLVIVFLSGGIFVSALEHFWGMAILLGIFLLMTLTLVFLRSLFPKPGERH